MSKQTPPYTFRVTVSKLRRLQLILKYCNGI